MKRKQKQKLEFSDRIVLFLSNTFGKKTQSDIRIGLYGIDPLNK